VTAWVVLAGFGIAVVGVIAKVMLDLHRDLREDREAHGGRQTVAAAHRAWVIIGVVLLLVLLIVVLPLVLASDETSPLP
jgi:H+/Cl- antiporter ClcA